MIFILCKNREEVGVMKTRFVYSTIAALALLGLLISGCGGGDAATVKGAEKVEFLLGDSLSLGSLTPKARPVSVLACSPDAYVAIDASQTEKRNVSSKGSTRG